MGDFTANLEFYNPDKGRKTLNLTEKYKKQSAGSKENKKSKSSGKRVQKMKCQIVGVQRKTGSFTPKDRNEKVDYDNIVMHCVHKDMHVAGDAVDTVSVKASEAGELIAAVGGDMRGLVGHVFDFDFSKFGKMVAFELVK